MRVDGVRNGLAVVHERGDRRVGESEAEVFEDALAAAHAGEPVVAERDAVSRRRGG